MSDPNPYQSFGTEPPPPNEPPPPAAPVAATDTTWPVLLHLSQFAGYAIPFLGFVAPIAIWLINKDESPEIDAHGRAVMNWMISSILYWILVVFLIFFFIGIPLAVLLGGLGVIFPIVGAVKASNGVVWNYPLSIKFF